MSYFPEQDSIYRRCGDNIEGALTAVAERYIGSAPKHPPVYRVFCENGFKRGGDTRYEFDLAAKCGHARDLQFVFVWGKLWSDQEADGNFSVSCFGPLHIFVNGEPAFRSNIQHESFPDRKYGVGVKLRQGWNHFVLRFMKTAAGFGGRFGSGSAKRPVHFLAPSPEREGQEGWIFSEPTDAGTIDVWPAEGVAEPATDVRWGPSPDWNETELRSGQLARMFGTVPGRFAYGRAKLRVTSARSRTITLRGEAAGSIAIYVNGDRVYSRKAIAGGDAAAGGDGPTAVPFDCPVTLSYGDHELIVESECPPAGGWGFCLVAETGEEGDGSTGGGIRIIPAQLVEGADRDDPWMYAGPFGGFDAERLQQLRSMHAPFAGADGEIYWRVDRPGCQIRAYLENPLYGHWNYPLGVTLYGLLQTGLELGRDDYVDYTADHIRLATSNDRYALWDRERYGAAGINPLLSAIDSLDDCGSFGATTLAAMKVRELEGARAAVDRIALYIRFEQDRQPDGALYREHGSVEFMKDTMWCDNLYMSTPFMIRYYELTGDTAYLDDAASQFLLYRKYLFMEGTKVMSHVYDFKYDHPNGVPWGRGNGWVLFSLAELLTVIPERHAKQPELLSFFRELCEGYLRLQGVNGLWHQVLNIPESYEESSCTSMFVYAFAMGVRCGWLSEPEPYIAAVGKGWEGLTRISIDKQGNVFGVCRGSGYSFSPLYYKDELSWNLNDTHGIGIVLLAGVETLRMRRHLAAMQRQETAAG
ncbi:glycoside hydrolase family 88/105 protein [Paenibacillus humicola]|uniref:glycoside hydrolase family 88/105 protein n=1 Tax=Paenibacillus humicola TaxID=3110540 RepID=UPI00237AFD17|nr:glycoside hydrolase family 88 protein [Paenibacillus humicola]